MTVGRGKKGRGRAVWMNDSGQGQIGLETRDMNERESGKKAGQIGNEDRGHGQEGQEDRARRAGDRRQDQRSRGRYEWIKKRWEEGRRKVLLFKMFIALLQYYLMTQSQWVH
jgi:hypothetical protein